VHTHITNTRIGDVEILERRYPVLLHRFGLREGSAGVGKWMGGEGVVREIELLEGMQVSILSEVSAGFFVYVFLSFRVLIFGGWFCREGLDSLMALKVVVAVDLGEIHGSNNPQNKTGTSFLRRPLRQRLLMTKEKSKNRGQGPYKNRGRSTLGGKQLCGWGKGID
jgi:hypothetical protein